MERGITCSLLKVKTEIMSLFEGLFLCIQLYNTLNTVHMCDIQCSVMICLQTMSYISDITEKAMNYPRGTDVDKMKD